MSLLADESFKRTNKYCMNSMKVRWGNRPVIAQFNCRDIMFRLWSKTVSLNNDINQEHTGVCVCACVCPSTIELHTLTREARDFKKHRLGLYFSIEHKLMICYATMDLFFAVRYKHFPVLICSDISTSEMGMRSLDSAWCVISLCLTAHLYFSLIYSIPLILTKFGLGSVVCEY